MDVNGDLRVGVVGTGAGVRTHIPVWAATPGARVTAVWSHHEDRARSVAEQFGLPHACTDVAELARLDDVDLVVVATTPDLHRPATMAAIDAGKHVLCEKPFAMDAAEASEMLAAARSRGVHHLVNHEFRVDPAVVQMKRLLDEGVVGRLTYVSLTDFGDFVTSTQGILSRWWFQEARGGGWLAAHGSHRVDELRALFGEITEVCAVLETSIPHPQRSRGTLDSEVDDGYFLLLRFASGAIGACLDGAASGVAARPTRLEVHGTDGSLVLDGDRLVVARPGEPRQEVVVPAAEVPGLESRADVLHGLWFRRIVDAIRDDAPLRPDFEDGLREMLVLDACRRSHAERRWIAVAPER